MTVAKPASPLPLSGIVVSHANISGIPEEGVGWDDDGDDNGLAVTAAIAPSSAPDLASDSTSDEGMVNFAKAIAFTKEPLNPSFGFGLNVDAIRHIIAHGLDEGTEKQPMLAFARGLPGFIFAAELHTDTGLTLNGLAEVDPVLDAQFRAWLAGPARSTKIGGMTLIQAHETLPSYLGLHAGACRLAIARYIGDTGDFQAASQVFRAWLGDRDAHDGFQWGARHWQADEEQPYGINPAGALKLDSAGVEQDIDGVLPDDQRRASGPDGLPPSFQWDAVDGPAKTARVYDALQGAVLSAIIISRAGIQGWGGTLFDPWEAGDEALLRAFEWLNDVDRGNFPVDDVDVDVASSCWAVQTINEVYGEAFTAPTTGPDHTAAFGFVNYFLRNETWPAAGDGGGGGE